MNSQELDLDSDATETKLSCAAGAIAHICHEWMNFKKGWRWGRAVGGRGGGGVLSCSSFVKFQTDTCISLTGFQQKEIRRMLLVGD